MFIIVRENISKYLADLECVLKKAAELHFAYKILMIIILIGLIFAPGIDEYLYKIFDPHYAYRDDTIFLPPFQKYLPNPVPSDYIKDYYLSAVIPYGFKYAMEYIHTYLDVHLWVAIIKLSTMALMILLVGFAGWKLGGAITCFAVLALFFYSKIFFDFALNGITPRTLAYPFMVMAILFIIKKRIYAMAVLVVTSALIYPQSTFILGAAMGIWLLLIPKENVIAANNWVFYKKILLLATTALLTFGIVLQQIIASSAYGRRMTEADVPGYPEIGDYGIYGPVDALPYHFLFRDIFILQLGIFTTNCSAYVFAITSFIIFYAIGNNIDIIYKRNPKYTAVFVIMAAGFITHTLAYIFTPYFYIPIRYLYYTFPVFIIFITPIALEKLFGKYFKNYKILPAFLAASLIGIFSISGAKSIASGLDRFEEYNVGVHKFINTLPMDIVIAGWPNGVVNTIPLFVQRTALITIKTHDVFFKNELEEMRKRVYAIIDVYFSISTEPLLRLKNEFKVTHFIVDKRYFSGEEKLKYSQPFQDVITEKLKSMSLNDGILMNDSLKKAVIYEDEYFRVIDLERL